jgi:uncharacterized protein YbjT (DUF2867 family)
MANERVLLTGATGFVGKSLRPALEAAGYQVRGGTRSPERAAASQPGRDFVHVDTNDERSLREALAGCAGAFYLIHGMASGGDYAVRELAGALAFRRAAEAEGVQRIVYLGGMRPRGAASRHLESRLQTGEVLRGGPVPTLELQATMVIGSGSESFRMVRDLSARLPLMVLPAWMKSLSQPISIQDVVVALLHALAEPPEVIGAFALPGPETLSAREILARTAKLMGHRPYMIGVPFVTPKLSSYWIRLVTRADFHVATQLVEGLRNDIVHEGPGYWARLPQHRLQSFDDAARNALAQEESSLGKRARSIEQLIAHVSPKEPHGRA